MLSALRDILQEPAASEPTGAEEDWRRILRGDTPVRQPGPARSSERGAEVKPVEVAKVPEPETVEEPKEPEPEPEPVEEPKEPEPEPEPVEEPKEPKEPEPEPVEEPEEPEPEPEPVEEPVPEPEPVEEPEPQPEPVEEPEEPEPEPEPVEEPKEPEPEPEPVEEPKEPEPEREPEPVEEPKTPEPEPEPVEEPKEPEPEPEPVQEIKVEEAKPDPAPKQETPRPASPRGPLSPEGSPRRRSSSSGAGPRRRSSSASFQGCLVIPPVELTTEIDDIFHQNEDIAWVMVAGIGADGLEVRAKGKERSIAPVREILARSKWAAKEVVYIYARRGIGVEQRPKFLRITWSGPQVSPVAKAKAWNHEQKAKKHFKHAHVEMSVGSSALLTDGEIDGRLMVAGGANYDGTQNMKRSDVKPGKFGKMKSEGMKVFVAHNDAVEAARVASERSPLGSPRS